MPIKTIRGFTLLEVLIGVFIMTVVLVAAVPVVQKVQEFLLRGRTRIELMSQSRTSMDTILSMLRQGRGNTVQIDSPQGAPPYSRIRFRLAGSNRLCQIEWQNSQVVLSIDNVRSKTLAENVRFLSFTGTTADPGTLNVSLELFRRINNTYDETVLVDNHTVRMNPQ
jgi:prepilin-type N-terminal cleavage/methylation domain-containing protein